MIFSCRHPRISTPINQSWAPNPSAQTHSVPVLRARALPSGDYALELRLTVASEIMNLFVLAFANGNPRLPSPWLPSGYGETDVCYQVIGAGGSLGLNVTQHVYD